MRVVPGHLAVACFNCTEHAEREKGRMRIAREQRLQRVWVRLCPAPAAMPSLVLQRWRCTGRDDGATVLTNPCQPQGRGTATRERRTQMSRELRSGGSEEEPGLATHLPCSQKRGKENRSVFFYCLFGFFVVVVGLVFFFPLFLGFFLFSFWRFVVLTQFPENPASSCQGLSHSHHPRPPRWGRAEKGSDGEKKAFAKLA